jgi:hypothetical protein
MMKYKTFRMIRFIVIIAVIIGLIILLASGGSKKKKSESNISENLTQVEKVEQKIQFGAEELSLSAIDKEIFEYQKSSPSTGELDKKGESYKRVINTSAYKLELRNDFKKGFTYWNRIKIDYDKDKSWDEQWSFSKDGKIKREVSPNDNDNYEYTYYLKSDKWEKK